MAKTKTFTVDNITLVAITVNTPCQKVTIYENAQAGTANYNFCAPTNGDTQVTKPAGQKLEFLCTPGRLFQVGQVLGYIIMASGAPTWAQEEI